MNTVFAAALVVFCEGFVLWSVFPILNYYCTALGVPDQSVLLWVGALLFLQSAPRIVFSPLFGRLSDRFGRGTMMTIASSGTLLGSVLFAVAPNAWWLVPSRLLAGIFGAQATLSAAVVADATPLEKRSSAMAILGAAFGLSMILGPLVAGLLAKTISYGAIGWVSAAFQAVSALTAAIYILPHEPKTHAARRSGGKSWRELFRLTGVTTILAASLVMTIAQLEAMSTFSEFARVKYAFNVGTSSYAFALLGLVAVVAQGGVVRHLAPRIGDKALGVAGLALLAAGGTLLAITPPVPVLILALVLLATGGAFSMTALSALASGCVDGRDQGAMQGALQGVFSLGRSIGSPLGGLLVTLLGFAVPYALAAVLSGIGVGLLLGLRMTNPGTSAAETPVETMDV